MQKNFEGKIYLSSELRAPRVEESTRPTALEVSSRAEREVVLYKPPQSRALREAKTLFSLLAASSADLYLKNSFRVLKKHVHSPLADIDAALSGSIAIEASKPQAPDHRLFSRFQASPTPQDQAYARDRLFAPEQRLIDEFFWFWPQAPGDVWDEGLRLLVQDKIKECGKLWLLQEKQQGNDSIALHNLAVLYHLSSINVDLERLEKEISPRRREFAESSWKQSIRRWEILLRNEGAWQRFEERASIVMGPTQGISFVQDFKKTLPRALIALQIDLARRAVDMGLIEEVHKHKARLDLLPFDPTEVREAIESSLHPVSSRIWDLCEEFSVENSDVRTPLSLKSVGVFFDGVEPLVQLLDAFLEKDAEDLTHTRNHVARVILSRAKHSNWAGDSGTAVVDALKRAQGIALDPELEQQISQTQAELTGVIEVLNTCFFTANGSQKSNPDAAVSISIHGEVGLNCTFGQVAELTWERRDFLVPRSEKAKKIHHRQKTFKTALIVSTVSALALISCLPFDFISTHAWGEILFGVAMCISLAALVISLIGRLVYQVQAKKLNIRPFEHVWKYPGIQDLLNKGWSQGEKPKSAPKI